MPKPPDNPCQLIGASHVNHEEDWCCGAWNPKRAHHCGLPAGTGTDHLGAGACKFHGGNTRGHRQHAAEIIARQECNRLGIPVEIDASAALEHSLWVWNGAVEFYAALVSELPIHPSIYRDEDGKITSVDVGIYAPTYHQSGVATGEARPHVLISLLNEALRERSNVAVAILKAGIDERRQRLQEADAKALYGAIGKSLAAAGLSPDQLEVVRRELAANLRPQLPS